MKPVTSQRVAAVKPSPTLAMNARAAELKAQGKNIISLSVGEPDFNTPAHICARAHQAIDAGHTRYTAVDGIPELRQAIANKLQTDNQLRYTPDEILVSCGGKHAIFNLLQALINDGDEVIIPAPYWVSYPDMVHLSDGQPVIVSTSAEQRFKLTPEQLREAITPKTKLLILNSPSNPTGVAYSQTELAALAEVLLQHPQVWILSDDIYEKIYWGAAPFSNLANISTELKARTIVLNGVSKAYAMTGWRIGYAAGAAELIKAMKKVQSQSTSNPSSIAQYAALEAISGPQTGVAEMQQVFNRRHDALLADLRTLPGVECIGADGAFYLFPSIEKILAQSDFADDVAFAEGLLVSEGVAIVPGTAFGAPGHLRISYATSREIMIDAIARLKRFIEAI